MKSGSRRDRVKALLHVVPRAGALDAFDDRLREIAGELRDHPDAPQVIATPMFRLAQDPFGADTSYRGTLEVAGEALDEDLLKTLLSGLGDRIADVAHPDLSSLLLGRDVVFVASQRAPVRYQYAMRRNSSFDHEAYLERYREIHSRFGVETPGILGYVQFHVDVDASRRAAGRAAIGIWGVDSVSELHLASVEAFLAEVAKSQIGREAVADEEVFVDRAQSHDFCSHVEWPETKPLR